MRPRPCWRAQATGPAPAGRVGIRRHTGGILGYDAFISYSHTADAELAPAIRDGLQRFAKPWNRRRALSVFLDQASLEVSAGLKDSLQEKLAGTEWLVLLLSEESAGSRWVTEEITHWLTAKPRERIALVQTSGEIAWDDEADDFDMGRSTAVPEGLRGVYSGQGSEPLWLDLRWAADPGDEGLDLRNTRFRDAIATLAAPIHGKPKDELEGEDIRQHRRLVRLRRAAIAGLTLLTIAATIAGILALINAARARAEARTANARLLASQSRESFRPDQAVLVALEAMRIEPNVEARGSLLDAVRRGAHAVAYLHDGPEPIRTADVHPTRDLVATGGFEGVVAIWDVGGDGVPPPAVTFPAESGTEGLVAVGRLAFHPIAPVLYTMGTDRDLKAWDVADPGATPRMTASVANPLATQESVVTVDFRVAMAASPGGELLAAGSQAANRVGMWSLADPHRPAALGTFDLAGPDSPVAFAFHPGTPLLAVGTGGGFELWDVTDPAAPAFLGTGTSLTAATALVFHPDAPVMLAGGGGGGIQGWDVSDPAQPVELSPVAGDGLATAAPGPGHERVVTGGTDGRVGVWGIDLSGAADLLGAFAGHGGAVLTAAFVSDGSRVVSAEEQGAVIVWDASDVGGPGSIGTPLDGAPSAVSFSPEAGTFWTVDAGGSLEGWQQGTGGPAPVTQVGGGAVGNYEVAAAAGVVAVTADVPFDLGGDAGTIALWDATSRAPVWTDHEPATAGEAIALTDDGGLLAVGTARPGGILLYDLSVDGPPVELPEREPLHQESIVAALAFETSEALLAAGGGSLGGGSLRLWDVSDPASPALVFADEAITSVVRDVAFGAGGTRLVGGSDDGSLLWWDLLRETDQREGGPVPAHAGPVNAVAFSPDAATVVSGGADGRILMWDADSRTRIAEFADFGHPVTGLAFAPDGGRLISTAAGFSQGFFAWELDPDEWRRVGCSFTNRNMTDEEWARYAGADEPKVEHCDTAAEPGAG